LSSAFPIFRMHNFRYLFIIFSCAVLCAIFVYHEWQKTVFLHETNAVLSWYSAPQVLAASGKRRVKTPEREAKGIYLTAYSAGSSKKLDQMIDLLNRTELNAVVIDIKDYSGKILYDSDVPLVNELQTEDNRLGDVGVLIQKLHDHDIYVIARQTVFQDPILAAKKPEWAIANKTGGLWRDNKGLAWVDPTKRAVWEYNMDIAKEAAMLGFDEINFDYVRFPTDGNLSLVAYENGEQSLHEVMRSFFAHIDETFKTVPVWTSIDVFGLVMEHENGLPVIGQRMGNATDYVDYISPMMYPSHYAAGHLGLANPAAAPGVVIENGMKKGAPIFLGTRAKVRPWIQAFHLGAVYDAEKIRAQIDAVERHTDAGWLLWNAANRYGTDGLKLE